MFFSLFLYFFFNFFFTLKWKFFFSVTVTAEEFHFITILIPIFLAFFSISLSYFCVVFLSFFLFFYSSQVIKKGNKNSIFFFFFVFCLFVGLFEICSKKSISFWRLSHLLLQPTFSNLACLSSVCCFELKLEDQHNQRLLK